MNDVLLAGAAVNCTVAGSSRALKNESMCLGPARTLANRDDATCHNSLDRC